MIKIILFMNWKHSLRTFKTSTYIPLRTTYFCKNSENGIISKTIILTNKSFYLFSRKFLSYEFDIKYFSKILCCTQSIRIFKILFETTILSFILKFNITAVSTTVDLFCRYSLEYLSKSCSFFLFNPFYLSCVFLVIRVPFHYLRVTISFFNVLIQKNLIYITFFFFSFIHKSDSIRNTYLQFFHFLWSNLLRTQKIL